MSTNRKSGTRERSVVQEGGAAPLEFSRLDDQRFEVKSHRDFDSVTQLMNDRFGGLPSFHQSVHLDVTSDQKLIRCETGSLSIPSELLDLVEPHLKSDLQHLVDHITRGEGVKSLGILCIDIGLNQDFFK